MEQIEQEKQTRMERVRIVQVRLLIAPEENDDGSTCDHDQNCRLDCLQRHRHCIGHVVRLCHWTLRTVQSSCRFTDHCVSLWSSLRSFFWSAVLNICGYVLTRTIVSFFDMTRLWTHPLSRTSYISSIWVLGSYWHWGLWWSFMALWHCISQALPNLEPSSVQTQTLTRTASRFQIAPRHWLLAWQQRTRHVLSLTIGVGRRSTTRACCIVDVNAWPRRR